VGRRFNRRPPPAGRWEGGAGAQQKDSRRVAAAACSAAIKRSAAASHPGAESHCRPVRERLSAHAINGSHEAPREPSPAEGPRKGTPTAVRPRGRRKQVGPLPECRPSFPGRCSGGGTPKGTLGCIAYLHGHGSDRRGSLFETRNSKEKTNAESGQQRLEAGAAAALDCHDRPDPDSCWLAPAAGTPPIYSFTNGRFVEPLCVL